MTRIRVRALATSILGLASIATTAAADVAVMPAAGEAAFSSEAGEFRREWVSVCYSGTSTSWRAWLIPIEVPQSAPSFSAYWSHTGGALAEGRVATWNTGGTLYQWSSWSTSSSLGSVSNTAGYSPAVHLRMKTDASGTDPCASSVRVYW